MTGCRKVPLKGSSRVRGNSHARFFGGWAQVTASGYPPKVKGVWKYLYRAVDKAGKTIDFLLTAKRDTAAAKRFFDKAMRDNGVPEKVTMDKSGSNKAAIDEINVDRDVLIVVRQVKYLNNLIEQDHRAIKRVTKPMMNFKCFRSARNVLAGSS